MTSPLPHCDIYINKLREWVRKGFLTRRLLIQGTIKTHGRWTKMEIKPIRRYEKVGRLEPCFGRLDSLVLTLESLVALSLTYIQIYLSNVQTIS